MILSLSHHHAIFGIFLYQISLSTAWEFNFKIKSTIQEILGLTPSQSCTSASIPYPQLFGAVILSVTASPVFNYSSSSSSSSNTSFESIDHFLPIQPGLDFCNVTVTYTHPGYSDEINVSVWLPLSNWNGRFLGTGGGGFLVGRGIWGEKYMTRGLIRGFAAASTDGGHTTSGTVDSPTALFDPSSWALTSPGNINWPLLENFAHRAVYDAAVIGKAVTASFYGEKVRYSYFSGCSTGGRQGLMMAQRYPDVFDGILSEAPAINFATFVPAEFWPHVVMKEIGHFPPACELKAITDRAIEICDDLDGVKDGIISAPGLCSVSGEDLVGREFMCSHDDGGKATAMTISAKAVQIAQATWAGPRTNDGEFLWYGLTHDAPLTSLARTTCSSSFLRNCKSAPFPISEAWLKYFIVRDPSFNPAKLTPDTFASLIQKSTNHLSSIISTSDANLSGLRKSGNKVLMWHGQQDELIPLNGSINYAERVVAADKEDAGEYFRFFEAPGVMHCTGGNGFFPGKALEELMEWVERGKGPEVLVGTSVGGEAKGRTRPLCVWPKVAVLVGGDENVAESFECRDSY